MSAHRRLIPLRGTSAATLRAAEQLLATLDPAQVLWVGTGPGAGPAAVSPPSVRKLLGRAFDAVVVDLHEDVSPDLLGQVHGFIWGGGALVLRLPSEGEQPSALGRNLVVKPYGPSDVGTRFWRRLEQWLPAVSEPEVLSPQRHAPAATDEQDEVVRTLDEAWARSTPARHALLADRGRGKSSALGRAIASLGAEVRVAVASMNEAAAAEVLRFAADRAGTPARGLWRSPAELLRAAGTFDVIVVDEAAQVPVPTLQRIVRAHPDAHLAFATTARGYEGTGRGFVLRFLAWLEQQPLPVTTVRLHGPIRWSRTDRLEAQVFSLLALDAGPSEDLGRGTIEAARLDRDALASDEALLRQVFGLLVHAHYRTTPADLHRLLDAPNLEVHALLRE
ncbi:MAG: tRNA(Met) cytidine acetyltransferase, partial [Deltaproteobacteria bacterium]|nr:tRNA(Met) cytidine acetyltransferase [Deltaproteobacteria bacterium]